MQWLWYDQGKAVVLIYFPLTFSKIPLFVQIGWNPLVNLVFSHEILKITSNNDYPPNINDKPQPICEDILVQV